MSIPTFIDSHCHLNRIALNDFNHNFDELMQEVAKANVVHMLCVSIDLTSWQEMADLVSAYDNVSLSVGVHPSSAHEEATPSMEIVSDMLANPKVIAIGETGLDYYWSDEFKPQQQEAFIAQIDIAKKAQKPLIIHTRSAKEDTINILQKEHAEDAGGILHCFTEDWDTAKKGLDLGFYISFSGIVTFNNASALREVMKKVPLDRLLIETDSPYLAPMPYRGKINRPTWVPYVAKTMADIKGVSLKEIAEITSRNFTTLFNLTL